MSERSFTMLFVLDVSIILYVTIVRPMVKSIRDELKGIDTEEQIKNRIAYRTRKIDKEMS